MAQIMSRRLLGVTLVIAGSILVLWNSKTSATVVRPMATNCPAAPPDAQGGFSDVVRGLSVPSSALQADAKLPRVIPTARVVLSYVTATFQTSGGLPIPCINVLWKTIDKKLSSTSAFRTDSNGRITFPVLPSGDVEFSYSATWLGARGVILNGGTKVVNVPTSGRTLQIELADDPPTTFARRIKVVMPDGSPVPGAMVSWISTDLVGCGSGYRLDGAQGTPWCLGPSMYKLSDESGLAWMRGFDGQRVSDWEPVTEEEGRQRLTSDVWADEYGGGRNWIDYHSLCARPVGCPTNIALVKFEDSYLSQTAWTEFEAIVNSAGLGAYASPIVVELEQMPVVKIISDEFVEANVGDPIDVVVSTVDGSGRIISGKSVKLERIGAAGVQSNESVVHVSGETSCTPRLTGVSNARGQVTLRICASSTSKWRVDGKGIVGSKALSVKVRPRTVRVGKSIAISSVLGSVIPRGAKVSVVVDRRSVAVCSGDSTTLRGLRAGTCSAVVTVTPSGKIATKTKVVITVVG